MKTSTIKITKLGFMGSFTALTLIAAFAGCQSSTDTDSTTRPVLGFLPPPTDKTGEQLWSDNCARCHNGRPPQEYSPRQWDTIVHHMRLRANLTGEEQRKITDFLKASS